MKKKINRKRRKIKKRREEMQDSIVSNASSTGLVTEGKSLGANDLHRLQQHLGNRAVNSLLRAPGQTVQREEGRSGGLEEEEHIDFSRLSVTRKTPGHGNLGDGTKAAVPVVQRENGSGSGVTANITYTINEPAITRKPAAEIATAHGRPGVAGWTTPQYAINVSPTSTPTNLTIGVTLDFNIELASEYSGATLSVLQEHEMGHVNIGTQKGQDHFVDGFEAALESQASVTIPAFITARNNAESAFVSEEAAESKSYDDADYPRMEQAYHGARTPLADLEAGSGNIGEMASSLRLFNSGIMLEGALRFQPIAQNLAQAVIDAQNNLSNDELNQLQYNPEFKALVQRARSKIAEYIEHFHYDLWLVEFSFIHEATQQKLDLLGSALDNFTWAPTV